MARQGVEVLVKHLSANVLSLSKNTVLLNKAILLENPEIKGKLVDGQIHQVKLSLENGPSLVFFSQTSTKSTSTITLTEQQIQSLLRLPCQTTCSQYPCWVSKTQQINSQRLMQPFYLHYLKSN